MRICLISKEYPPDTGWGGIGTFTYHLAHGLQEIGHDVEVISLAGIDKSKPKQDSIVVHRANVPNGLELLTLINYSMPYSHYMMRTNIALWDKFLEIHKKKPFDVVDAPELLAESILVGLTRIAPLVVRLYTPHSKFISDNLNNVTAAFDHKFLAMVERMAMLSSDVLTSPSLDLAKFVSQDLSYPLNKIKIIRNPIDTNQFTPEGTRTISNDGKLNILFVGRLEERKGIRYLVAAIPEIVKVLPNVRFTIIGDDAHTAQKNYANDLRKNLAKSNCLDKVEWITRVPLHELPGYYRSADMLVAPSLYDNSPYTCIEAMACGTPVIGTSSGGTSEYVIDGESGIIIGPKDANALAQAVIRLGKDANLRQQYGQNARKHAVLNFDRKVIAKKTTEIYDQAIQSFQVNNTSALYLKDPNELVPDLINMLYSCHQSLYNFMYLHSFKFRLKHWFLLLCYRPKLTFARALIKAIKVPLRITKCNSSIVQQLESSIELKDKEREEATRKRVGVRLLH